MFRLLLEKKKLILWPADWVTRVREVLSLAGVALVSAFFFLAHLVVDPGNWAAYLDFLFFYLFCFSLNHVDGCMSR